MATNEGKTGFVVRPVGRDSWCGFEKAHTHTQLAHSNPLYVQKCIPDLRKIGYQRGGKYDFLPADTLSQKKEGFTQHPLHYTAFVACRRKISAHVFWGFWCVCVFKRTHLMDERQIFLAELNLAWQNTKVHSQ